MRKITLDEKQSLENLKRIVESDKIPLKRKSLVEKEDEFKRRFAREVFGIVS